MPVVRAAFTIGGAGEQGKFFIGHLQDIHQRQGRFHLGNGILFVLPEVCTVVGVVGDGSTSFLARAAASSVAVREYILQRSKKLLFVFSPVFMDN